ncbi:MULTISPECIES: WXG100 family type VII secretion target [Paenibacillus]|uniref:ESAT-6-like protein n=1 Tax=Paenibacillus barcinonensis TaxID=198119 RepID=A0A2V4USZ2_PAEBA|nr:MULTISPECIES: WXG100 family type VII secretion target [Paenibacillus]MCK6078282.1 WXG100 family type VII secretion target [Paenibacillus silvae]MCK6150478.1 WXG100 family type VII secretion target [Paenibacillus silvae]MCK6270331.1 WXG100 family type VII secretion target [Paenibacillus silvae]PYE43203.1 WXG100 family type VII secretion target [Paenibacillus barcinonensis]QKS57015.1 WXG100 family type VII secretion target [Paenibacillus barcinonensis]
MAKIRITPEEMDQASNKFKDAHQQSAQLNQQLNSLMQTMHGEWEGMQSQGFYQRYDQHKKTMESYIEMLDIVSQNLQTIADNFRRADEAK